MLPSFCLVFTEPFNSIGKIVLILFPLGLYMTILTLSKNTALIQLLLFPLLFLHAFQLVLFYLFGEEVIAVDMFLNLVTTNPSEANEVLNSIWVSVAFVIIVYIPTIVFAIIQCKHKIYLVSKFRWKVFSSGILFMLISYILSFFAVNINYSNFDYKSDVYPINVIYNLDFAIRKWNRSKDYPKTSKDFSFNAHRDTISVSVNDSIREVYVIVVGETGRADNWQLYGYDRQTTPLLEQTDGLVFFRDALTQSNTTHKSVSIILSAVSAENYNELYGQKSIIEAFKEVGFKTMFLSNQVPNRTFTEYFADEADYTKYLRALDKEGLRTVNSMDEDLLPLFQHCLDSIEGNLFFVLHTYGSHFKYNERYPESFSHFKPNNVTNMRSEDPKILVNSYDNTILYTDYFLSSLTNLIGQSGAYSALYYASDHGEDLMDDKRMRTLHASPNPTYYQLHIPMLMWFSESYRNLSPYKYNNAIRNKDMPVSTNAVFHSMLDAANIKSDYFKPNLSLVGNSFKKTKRMYLNDHDEPIFFYNANLKKEDKLMIDKNNIYH